ncbi:MAG TPA: hypothetical protein PKB10_00880, partial [Tepidisphaeraceae bacterium]|nr:hypothetical protein [Tepidisphaeraceae bacterium]
NPPRLLSALALAVAVPAAAHNGHQASVHDTVAAVTLRLKAQLPAAELRRLDAARIEAFLTPAERDALGSHHLTFRVSAPAVVTVFR